MFLCRDLEPFSKVDRPGFKDFCSKNVSFELPARTTLSTTALFDVYSEVKKKIQALLSDCIAGTLMMDAWTDKYRRLPYFAIRISIIHDWQFKILTLAIDLVESHTSESLQRYVRSVISTFLDKKPMLFNTTDSAANMKLLSKLLGHERIDCIAHCLHLLLTADSMHKVPEIRTLLKKCKEVISTLHFKGHLVAQEVKNKLDAEAAELFEQIQEVNEQLTADEDCPVEH